MSYINYTYTPPPTNAFGLTERNMNSIRSIFQKFPSVKEVLLFGSRATGSYKPGSDIDLTIMNPDFEQQQYLSIVNEFYESDIPYFTDVLVYPKLKNEALKEQIVTFGKLIYTASSDVAAS